MKIAPLLIISLLSGCGSLFGPPGSGSQEIVDKRAIGVSVSAFFERYGGPLSRREELDGTLTFNWQTAPADTQRGWGDPLERCQLHITADKSGRIVAALIAQDGEGKRHGSRCADVFD